MTLNNNKSTIFDQFLGLTSDLFNQVPGRNQFFTFFLESYVFMA